MMFSLPSAGYSSSFGWTLMVAIITDCLALMTHFPLAMVSIGEGVKPKFVAFSLANKDSLA